MPRYDVRHTCSTLTANLSSPPTVRDRSIPLLPLGVLILLVALTYWLSRYVQPGDARADGNKRHDPDLIIENFAAKKLSESGDVQYVVNAARMAHFPDDDSSLMETIVFRVTEPGRPLVTATAPRGELLRHADGSDEIVMTGGVRIESQADEKHASLRLTTPKATAFPDKNLLRSTDGVVLESATGKMTATSIELNSETRKYSAERVELVYKR
jgi:lipopolysaccharide export system protein LptC